MGEIGNIGDLDLENYHIGFCSQGLDINKYCIDFLKILLFEVRNVSMMTIDESMQFNTNSQQ